MINENKMGAIGYIDIMNPIPIVSPVYPTEPSGPIGMEYPTGATGPTGSTGSTGPAGTPGTTPTTGSVPLRLDKSSCTCNACVGEEISYTIKVTNTSSSIIRKIVIEDILPKYVYVSMYYSSIGKMVQSTTKVTWSEIDLLPGQVATAIINLVTSDKICLSNPYIINVAQVTSYNNFTNIGPISDRVITHIDCFCCDCKK